MTTYRFTAERSHQWWAIISPDVTGAATQARRLDQAEPMAREVISLLLEVPEDDIDIDLEVILDDDGQAALAMASPHTSTHGPISRSRRASVYGPSPVARSHVTTAQAASHAAPPAAPSGRTTREERAMPEGLIEREDMD